jgi:4'-phosphopantetheinyl transferase
MTVSIWRQLTDTPRLKNGEVHLYRIGLTGKINTYRHILSTDEMTRARRLLDIQKQHAFIACRGMLRQILSQYLEISAQDIVFQYNDNGKPSLAPDHCSDLVFNLSHSAECAVIAVTRGTDIGVDIEKIDPALEFHKLAERFFDQNEQAVLHRTPTSRQRRTFYRLWTVKEAQLKMIGSGFTQLGVHADFLRHFYLFPDFVATLACHERIATLKKYAMSA